MASVRQTTAVRFSLRSVMIAIGVVAAYFAAVAPVFRRWSSPEQVAFLKVWGVALIGWVGLVVVHSAMRLRAERRAGEARLSLRRRGAPVLIFVGTIVGGAHFAAVTIQAFTAAKTARLRTDATASVSNHAPAPPIWLGGIAGIATAVVAARALWRADRVEFCDRGILSYVSCTPWAAVDYEWLLGDPCFLKLWLREGRTDVIVTAETWAVVNDILSRRCASLASTREN